MEGNGSAAARGSLPEPGLADADLVSDWYIYESGEPAAPQDDMFPGAIPDCDPTISPQLYHTCMAPISLAVLVGLSLLLRRRRLSPSCWRCVPGLLSPARFLEEDGERGLVAAVFGILFSSLCVLLLDTDPLPLVAASSQHHREYWKILALLYYPAFYYPLAACATARHRLGYLAGCLLSWCHCVVHVWQKVDCPQSPKIYRYYSVLSYVPLIICLVVLSLWYPVLLLRSFTAREESLEKEIAGQSYCRKYLQALLSKQPRKDSSCKLDESCSSRARAYLRSYIYTPQEGFRIPLTLVLSLTTAVIAVYQVALLLLVAVVPTLQIVRAGMTKDVVVLLVQFGLVPSANPGGVPGDMEAELGTVKHYLWSLEGGVLRVLAGALLPADVRHADEEPGDAQEQPARPVPRRRARRLLQGAHAAPVAAGPRLLDELRWLPDRLCLPGSPHPASDFLRLPGGFHLLLRHPAPVWLEHAPLQGPAEHVALLADPHHCCDCAKSGRPLPIPGAASLEEGADQQTSPLHSHLLALPHQRARGRRGRALEDDHLCPLQRHPLLPAGHQPPEPRGGDPRPRVPCLLPLPQGGGEPVAPGDEGVLLAAAAAAGAQRPPGTQSRRRGGRRAADADGAGERSALAAEPGALGAGLHAAAQPGAGREPQGRPARPRGQRPPAQPALSPPALPAPVPSVPPAGRSPWRFPAPRPGFHQQPLPAPA